MKKTIIAIAIAIVAAFAVVFSGVNSVRVVPVGYTGVLTVCGVLQKKVYSNDWYIVVPFVSHMELVNIREQKIQYGFKVKGESMQDIKVSGALNYRVNEEKAYKLYELVGKDFQSVLIDPLLEGAISEITGKHSPEFIVSSQDMIRETLLYIMQDQLNQTELLCVNDVRFFRPQFDDKFEAAIKDKAEAQQLAEKAKFETLRVEEEARQMKLKLEAEASGLDMKSKAMSNPLIVEYEYAKAMGKWNGAVPSTLMVGKDGIPFVNVK